jgi:ketosteroid isomerase-like protein
VKEHDMSEQAQVEAAVRRFYDAIDALIRGEGTARMQECWHHTTRVTGGHPSGEWSQGWDEVLATWEVFASFGRSDRGGGRIQSLRVHVYGDVAYTVALFVVAPAFGGDTLACTNVLHRVDGQWKLVHHHADKSPRMAAALEKIARGE